MTFLEACATLFPFSEINGYNVKASYLIILNPICETVLNIIMNKFSFLFYSSLKSWPLVNLLSVLQAPKTSLILFLDTFIVEWFILFSHSFSIIALINMSTQPYLWESSLSCIDSVCSCKCPAFKNIAASISWLTEREMIPESAMELHMVFGCLPLTVLTVSFFVFNNMSHFLKSHLCFTDVLTTNRKQEKKYQYDLLTSIKMLNWPFRKIRYE